MKAGPYTVVPHLDRYRIAGISGEAALVTFADPKEADRFCRGLCQAYWHGAEQKGEAVRTLIKALYKETGG